MLRDIPFNDARTFGNEERYVGEVMRSGNLAADGPFSERCRALLQELLDGPHVLMTSSCTHALEMCAHLVEVGPGDEVIVPSFTFASTINAFALRGARPVFADVRPDTFNLDVSDVRRKLSPRTKAVVTVHYGGATGSVDKLAALCATRGVRLIEDNAHGLLGTYRGRALGTFGSLGTLSFHWTKGLTGGGGGALLINDESLLARARVLRDRGTDRSDYTNGRVDAYTWVDVGSNHAMPELIAAYLCGQLEQRHTILAHRRRCWERYDGALSSWAAELGVRVPHVPPGCRAPYLMYFLVLPTHVARDRFIAHLAARGVEAAFHYPALHLSKMGRPYGGGPGSCPVSEAVSAGLVRLPLHNTLSQEEQTRVIAAVREFAWVAEAS
ncbi:MAG: dTDP-4-amino-4,6-dideoxygalactose transaminase [bacterium]|nr:dTDP-4-amino-4,6-dideoxygalactose transaminase [bacterium]